MLVFGLKNKQEFPQLMKMGTITLKFETIKNEI